MPQRKLDIMGERTDFFCYTVCISFVVYIRLAPFWTFFEICDAWVFMFCLYPKKHPV